MGNAENRQPEARWAGVLDRTDETDIISSDRARVEKRLDELIRALSYPNPPQVSSSGLMQDVAAQALLSDLGGKRLRALLLLATSRLSAGAADQQRELLALDQGCAIEIFQTGALVHDDIMDDSDERRGRPSAHRALADAIGKFAPSSLTAKARAGAGTGLGIMLGDLLATLSLRVAVRSLSDRKSTGMLVHPIVSRLLTMQQDVEIGQVLDEANCVISLDDPQALIRNCEAIYLRKTASYTCVAPISIGLLLAGFPTKEADRWAQSIGRPLGLAFQISDDLKDIVPSARPTGKPLFGDLREGKRTMLLADALRLGSPDERRTLARLYTASSRSENDVRDIRRILVSSGSIDASFRRLADLREEVDAAATQLADACRARRTGHTALPNTEAGSFERNLERWANLLPFFFVHGTAGRLE